MQSSEQTAILSDPSIITILFVLLANSKVKLCRNELSVLLSLILMNFIILLFYLIMKFYKKIIKIYDLISQIFTKESLLHVASFFVIGSN